MVMNTLLHASPQILSGTVSLANGMTQTVNLDAMSSRSHRWLRLEELSLAFWDNGDDTDEEPWYNYGNPIGSVIKVRARAYRQDLMLDYVPAWLIGPRLHYSGEFANSSVEQIPNYGVFETYRWKFAKPFFLPPGSAFVVQLQHPFEYPGQVLDVPTITAQVVVRATQMSEREARNMTDKQNPIPYMSAYTPTSFPAKSNNQDLANPFLTPLFLQRMTGRIGIQPDAAQYGAENGVSYGPTVKLTDTRTVICEPTQFMTVFPATQCAWTHTRILQPAEYITAELAIPTPSFEYAAPQVAIIGYRNEELP